MKPLDKKYLDALRKIAVEIQASDLLVKYLDDEDEEDYQAIRDKFEPSIHEIHEEVSTIKPLQILSLEKELLDPSYESLYLPRLLGYSVLRGAVNDQVKYYKPENHFKDILLTICNSANFDILKLRIGQSIQIGFALSSDIWITNLINSLANKKIQAYLAAHHLPKYRDIRDRKTGLVKFRKQFKTSHYHSIEIPNTKEEFFSNYGGLKFFIEQRISRYKDNSTFIPELMKLIDWDEVNGSPEHNYFLMLLGNFFDLSESNVKKLSNTFSKIRVEDNFAEKYFVMYHDLLDSRIKPNRETEKRFSKLIDKSINDDLTNYYTLMDLIHGKGYVHSESIEATRKFYYSHPGMSVINECLRTNILNNFTQFIDNLPEEDYAEYFEINKIFSSYIEIFSNQEFNQSIKAFSLKYIKKLLKKFPDKRGKDYQDIKKFVKSTFLGFGFMTDKQLVELFKTRRKRKPA